jgi:hypothetical protein
MVNTLGPKGFSRGSTRICMGRKKVNLSQVFAGQNVGVREEEDRP